MEPRGRHAAMWVIAATVVIVAAAVVWSVIGMRRQATKLLDRGPSVPAPTAADAAAVPLTADGMTVTIKQRSSAWLPGGKLKLHLDDITGGQVIISVTDTGGRVVLGPKSVTTGDKFSVGGMDGHVIRLENMAVGSGDFGEFQVKPASPTTRPAS
jgi:hypothetical protein